MEVMGKSAVSDIESRGRLNVVSKDDDWRRFARGDTGVSAGRMTADAIGLARKSVEIPVWWAREVPVALSHDNLFHKELIP